MADDPILIHLEYIKDRVDEINARLDQINGRTRTNETDIAVLKDRDSQAAKSGRNWGAGAGVLGGFLGGFLSSVFKGGGQ